MERTTDTATRDTDGFLEIPTRIRFDPDHISSKHKKQGTWKYTALCESSGDIDVYYSNFLFKRYGLELNRSLRMAHVTIINDRVDDMPRYEAAKAEWDGKELTFRYRPEEIRSNGTHWWLKVYCDEVAAIREMAGLTPQPYFNLHMTLGYANDRNSEHSQYILRQILRYEVEAASDEGVKAHKARKPYKPRAPRTSKKVQKVMEELNQELENALFNTAKPDWANEKEKEKSKRQFAEIGTVVRTNAGEVVMVTKKNAKNIGVGGFTLMTIAEVFAAFQAERARSEMYEGRMSKVREFFEPLREALY